MNKKQYDLLILKKILVLLEKNEKNKLVINEKILIDYVIMEKI